MEVEEVSAKTFTFFGGCNFVQFDIRQTAVDLGINAFSCGF